MQKHLFYCLCALISFSACHKSSDDNPGNSLVNNPPAGKWVVHYYWDKDKDETSDFSGYSFEFQSNGTLVATLPGGSTVSGTWSTSSSKLTISITGNDKLDDLTDDWLVIEQTDNLIKLKDDNDSHLEELHFKKI